MPLTLSKWRLAGSTLNSAMLVWLKNCPWIWVTLAGMFTRLTRVPEIGEVPPTGMTIAVIASDTVISIILFAPENALDSMRVKFLPKFT